MSARLLYLCLVLLTLPVCAARYYYTGAIGVRAAQMDLTFAKRGVELEPDLKPGELYGNYQYDDGALHWLHGTVRDGRVVLQECRNLYERTPPLSTFTGRIAADRKTVTGAWRDADGRNTQAFTLTAVAEYRTVQRPQRRLIELSGASPVFFAATPGLRALERRCREQLDTALTKFAAENRDAHDAGYTIPYYRDYTLNLAYYSPRLVSLRIEDNTFTGGAHGYEDTDTANYLVMADGPHLLGLHDVFNRNTRYLDAALDLVRANLEGQALSSTDHGPGWIDNVSPEIMTRYTISTTAITFIFPPYYVDGYAGGTYDATVPFGAFQGYLAHTNVTPLLQPTRLTPPASLRDPATLARDDREDDYATLAHVWYAWEAAALPKPQRDNYLQAMNILQKITTARYTLASALHDDYTTVDVFSVNQPAQADTFLAIVRALAKPTADPAARERARASLAAAETLANGLLIPPHTPADRPAYANASRNMLYGLADLTLAVPTWPDSVADLACGYVEQTMAPKTP